MFAYVCTNYNNTPYTRQAVSSLSKSGARCRQIVVVDNCSNPESVEGLRQLQREFHNVHLILNPSNVGYFRGLNLGIRHLRLNGPEVEIVVVGNNDLVFPCDFGQSLQKHRSLFDKYAVVSPDIITLDGIHQNPHVISRISKFRELIYEIYYADYSLAVAIRKIANLSRRFTERQDYTHHEIAQEIFMGLGACYLLGPVFFRHFEELWAPTFLMHEEYFLTKQLDGKGLRIYYEPSIQVQHHFQVSMGALGDRRAWELARDAHKARRQFEKTSAGLTLEYHERNPWHSVRATERK